LGLYGEQTPDGAALQRLLQRVASKDSPLALLLWGIGPRP
jgi:hypothetical protein